MLVDWRRSSLLMAALVAVAALLAACAPGSSPTTGPGGASSTARKGEFRIVQPSEPKTWDPNKSNFAQEIATSSLLFEGMLSFDKDLKLSPAVATQVPTTGNGGISADGKTYTYKLKDGMVWSDGKPVTAKDFEYSLLRTLNPDTGATYASTYFDITGAKDYNTSKGTTAAPKTPSAADLERLRGAVSVKAIDDKTLEIKLDNPSPSFNQRMALWPAYPNRQDIIEKFGDKWIEPANIVVNGPWKLSEYKEQTSQTFVPNDSYWGPKAKLDKLTYRFITDETAAYAAFQANEVDFVSVPTLQRLAVLADAARKPNLVTLKELVAFGVQMNQLKAPFDNLKVRQAFATAIDRAKFVKDIEQGVGQAMDGVIPEGMPGYDKSAGEINKFDAARAKKLLEEAGFPGGRGLPEIKFSYADTAGNKLRAEYLQAEFKNNLGVEIKLDPQESRAYTSFYTGNQHQMAFAGWGMDYADPDNMFLEVFKKGSGNNHSIINGDDEAERLMALAVKELDDTKRLDIWKQVQKRIMEVAPWGFTHYRNRLWEIKPQFQGLQTTAKDQLPGNRFYNLVSVK